MVDMNATAQIDNSFYDGLRSNLEYSTKVRIISLVVPLVSVLMHALLEASMPAAKRGDVLYGRDIMYHGGPDELPREMWMIVKTK